MFKKEKNSIMDIRLLPRNIAGRTLNINARF